MFKRFRFWRFTSLLHSLYNMYYRFYCDFWRIQYFMLHALISFVNKEQLSFTSSLCCFDFLSVSIAITLVKHVWHLQSKCQRLMSTCVCWCNVTMYLSNILKFIQTLAVQVEDTGPCFMRDPELKYFKVSSIFHRQSLHSLEILWPNCRKDM